ncbi:MAG TPA: nuclear transport factor 2 family protein [Mycobacteriales bacterium]|nr:nuclear transport factor 2 family protein [Mycobacteriales bacterium]
MGNHRTVAELAALVRVALETPDLEAFEELLDPAVTWGAPGDPSPSCRNRRQVLQWYRRGQLQGRRGRVVDTTTYDDKILVSLVVSDAESDSEFERWQVLQVAGGRVSDIRGYEQHADALAAAGGTAENQ